MSVSRSAIAANFGWLTMCQGTIAIVSAAVMFCLARHLGAAEFGRLAVAYSVCLLVSIISAMGVEQVVMAELVRRSDAAERLIAAAITFRALVSIIAMVSIWIVAATIYSGDPALQMLICVVALMLLPQPLQVVEASFHAQQRSRPVVTAKLIGLGIATSMRVAAIVYHAPLIFFAAIYPLATLIESVLILRRWLAAGFRTDRRQLELKELRRLFSATWPLALSLAAIAVLLRIDQVMIERWLGASEAGVYAAAILISEAVVFAPHMLARAALPSVVSAKDTLDGGFEHRIRQLHAWTTWPALLFAATLSAASFWLMPVLYGSGYESGGSVLAVLAWTLVFSTQGAMQTPWIIADHKQRYQTVGYLVAAMINIVLNSIWIPQYGIVGAAWATLIAGGVAVYLPLLLFRDMRYGGRALLVSYRYPFDLLIRRCRPPNRNAST